MRGGRTREVDETRSHHPRRAGAVGARRAGQSRTLWRNTLAHLALATTAREKRRRGAYDSEALMPSSCPAACFRLSRRAAILGAAGALFLSGRVSQAAEASGIHLLPLGSGL